MLDEDWTDGYALDAGGLLGQDHELALVQAEDDYVGRGMDVLLGLDLRDGEESRLVQVYLLGGIATYL